MVGIVNNEAAAGTAGFHEIDQALPSFLSEHGQGYAAQIEHVKRGELRQNFLPRGAEEIANRGFAAPVVERTLARFIGVYDIDPRQAPLNTLDHRTVDAFGLPGPDHGPAERIIPEPRYIVELRPTAEDSRQIGAGVQRVATIAALEQAGFAGGDEF